MEADELKFSMVGQHEILMNEGEELRQESCHVWMCGFYFFNLYSTVKKRHCYCAPEERGQRNGSNSRYYDTQLTTVTVRTKKVFKRKAQLSSVKRGDCLFLIFKIYF